MKIKVVDMPYEQALAQPREKHTLPRRPSMLFRALLRALSAPDLRATHFRCDRMGMERLGPDALSRSDESLLLFGPEDRCGGALPAPLQHRLHVGRLCG